MAKYGKKSTATQSNSGTTITNSAPNGFGSGVANQHSVLHVISESIFYWNFGILSKRKHATFHKKIFVKTE